MCVRYAMSAATGAVLWKFAANDWIVGAATVDSTGLVYVGSVDSNVYGINGTNGSAVWTFPTGGKVVAAPVIGPNA